MSDDDLKNTDRNFVPESLILHHIIAVVSKCRTESTQCFHGQYSKTKIKMQGVVVIIVKNI